MPLKSDCLKMYDFASVTPLGIRYQQLYYTCSKAIRERWFEISQRDGGWNIRIQYTPTDLSVIYLEADSEELEECRIVVRESLQGLNLDEYLQSVQLMKLAKQIIKNND
ncbi:hypothetical protein NSS94_21495 [Paenibacillus sp. FSL L8-0644]|uniref:hypothetical protein n=1 Tax=Paenibacillus sp. FSL L8-0644 TaxID=2954523 RepID=UPI0030FAC0E9